MSTTLPVRKTSSTTSISKTSRATSSFRINVPKQLNDQRVRSSILTTDGALSNGREVTARHIVLCEVALQAEVCHQPAEAGQSAERFYGENRVCSVLVDCTGQLRYIAVHRPGRGLAHEWKSVCEVALILFRCELALQGNDWCKGEALHWPMRSNAWQRM